MIMQDVVYVQCQCSVPMPEVGCPLCSEVESRGVEVGVLDGNIPLEFVSQLTPTVYFQFY